MANTKTPLRNVFRAALEGRSKSVASVLKNRDGIEVSIPNIIVAIVISLVVIAAVVVGIVFVVPWAQNSSAQGDLNTVQGAEQIYYSQAAPARYATLAELNDKGTNGGPALLKSKKQIVVNVSGDGQSYCAATLSPAGKLYWITSGSTDVVDTNPSADAGVTCPIITK